jgi:uncharacterized protein YdiU (UPF0061 family)
MGPKGKDASQKTLNDFGAEEQPQWAKKMEERLGVKFDQVAESVTVLEARLQSVEQRSEAKLKALESRLTEMEYHSRKYNLIFFGLEDQGGNAEKAVRTFLRTSLEIESADNMAFNHVHPLPAGRQGPPPIIARFSRFPDRERVLRSLGKLRGKGNKVTVATDLPKPMREKRQAMLEKVRAARQANPNKIVRLVERAQEIRVEEKVGGR